MLWAWEAEEGEEDRQLLEVVAVLIGVSAVGGFRDLGYAVPRKCIEQSIRLRLASELSASSKLPSLIHAGKVSNLGDIATAKKYYR